jgi:hypothetical protein
MQLPQIHGSTFLFALVATVIIIVLYHFLFRKA